MTESKHRKYRRKISKFAVSRWTYKNNIHVDLQKNQKLLTNHKHITKYCNKKWKLEVVASAGHGTAEPRAANETAREFFQCHCRQRRGGEEKRWCPGRRLQTTGADTALLESWGRPAGVLEGRPGMRSAARDPLRYAQKKLRQRNVSNWRNKITEKKRRR